MSDRRRYVIVFIDAGHLRWTFVDTEREVDEWLEANDFEAIAITTETPEGVLRT